MSSNVIVFEYTYIRTGWDRRLYKHLNVFVKFCVLYIFIQKFANANHPKLEKSPVFPYLTVLDPLLMLPPSPLQKGPIEGLTTICPPLPGLTRRARPERAEAAVSPSPPGRLAGSGAERKTNQKVQHHIVFTVIIFKYTYIQNRLG